MKAAVYYGPGDLRVEEVTRPQVEPGGILGRVKACAICGSDLKGYLKGNPRIRPPQVVGHEFVAEVVEVGAGVTEFSPGDRFTMATSIPCGRCRLGRRGRGNLCPDLKPMACYYPGAFAEYVAVPAHAVALGHALAVAQGVSDEAGCLAEPLSCAVNAQEIAGVTLGDTVVIVGAGPLGCLHAELARARGASRVIITQRSHRRQELARQFPVDEVVDASTGDQVERVRELTAGVGADVVIVAAPDPDIQGRALAMARKDGVVSLFAGLPSDVAQITVNSRLIHYGQVRLVGASDSTPQHLALALGLLEAGRISTEKLITHRLSLEDILTGYELMRSGEALKVLIYPGPVPGGAG